MVSASQRPLNQRVSGESRIQPSVPRGKPLLVIYRLGTLLRQGAAVVGMIDIELTPRERNLLLRYGYPFDQIKQALLTVSSSKSIECLSFDEF